VRRAGGRPGVADVVRLADLPRTVTNISPCANPAVASGLQPPLPSWGVAISAITYIEYIETQCLNT